MRRLVGLLVVLALAACQRPTGLRPERQPSLAEFRATSAEEDILVSPAMNHEDVPEYIDRMLAQGWLLKEFEAVEGSPGRYILTLRRPWRRR